MPQDAECDQSGEPLPVGRRLEQREAVEVDADGRHELGRVPPEVVQRELAALGPCGLRDALAERAGIQRSAAALGDRLERTREIRLLEPFASGRRAAARREDAQEL